MFRDGGRRRNRSSNINRPRHRTPHRTIRPVLLLLLLPRVLVVVDTTKQQQQHQQRCPQLPIYNNNNSKHHHYYHPFILPTKPYPPRGLQLRVLSPLRLLLEQQRHNSISTTTATTP